MKLSRKMRQRLAEELQFAVQRMQHESNPFRKLFFFSAGFGETGRLLNVTWDADLALLHIVLQTTHGAVNSRLQQITAGQERAIKLSENFFEALAQATSELADAILKRRDSAVCRALARLAELAYVTTGNGYYLYEKGLLKIQKDAPSHASTEGEPTTRRIELPSNR